MALPDTATGTSQQLGRANRVGGAEVFLNVAWAKVRPPSDSWDQGEEGFPSRVFFSIQKDGLFLTLLKTMLPRNDST